MMNVHRIAGNGRWVDHQTAPTAATGRAQQRLVSLTTVGIALLSGGALVELLETLFSVHLARPARVAAAVSTVCAMPVLVWAGVLRARIHRSALVRTKHAAERRRRRRDVLSAGDNLQVVFQPVVELSTGTCTGHEALARFADGRRPDEWFNEARAIGLGVELEMAAIAKATQRYRGTGRLSINLSPDTLTSPAFMEYLTHWEDASRMVIELTEHAIVEDYDQIATVVGRIRELGAQIAVDDAGSGTSSMRHILDLKPDIIKLDRSLIAGLDTDQPRRALAASLVRFAIDIDALLVAEGIEREEELTACLDLGITFGQGYLLGHPGPLTM
jgi:EAL domain-containing protein (putative c-di-GMP-specific phosphodiesterase class I)